MSIEIIRREIGRALASHRAAFRAVLSNWKHRASGANLVQGEGVAGEVLNDMEIMQHAGFVSGLPGGTQMVVLPLGGKTKHSIIIATEFGQYRLDVGVGEVAMHHLTEPDCYIHMKAGRVIEAKCRQFVIEADELVKITAPNIEANASTGVAMNTPEVSASTDIRAQRDIFDRGNKSMVGMRNTYNTHKHPENNAPGGTTNTPDNTM